MQIVKYLIANRYWVVDKTHLIQPTLQSMIILENRFPSGGIIFYLTEDTLRDFFADFPAEYLADIESRFQPGFQKFVR